MSSFFQNIVDNKLFTDWANTLDWLFDDEKFDSTAVWSKGSVRALTNRIKKLPKFSIGTTYQNGAIKSLEFPTHNNQKVLAIFSSDGSESKSFIKHIRNGIAHGRTRCFKNKNELFIEIKDYDKNKKQTAYMCFPMSYIVNIHKLYCDVKKAYENRKGNSNRKARKN